MGGYLTTHVLDTAAGGPRRGSRSTLYRVAGEARASISCA